MFVYGVCIRISAQNYDTIFIKCFLPLGGKKKKLNIMSLFIIISAIIII